MTPVSICFRPEYSIDHNALTAILGEQGIDPARIEAINTPTGPNARPNAHPEAVIEHFGEECFKVLITDPDELVDLIEAINMIPDSHRMLQTLDTEVHFDGDFIEGERERAGRILAILERAHEPERAKGIYRQILTGDDADMDAFLGDLEAHPGNGLDR